MDTIALPAMANPVVRASFEPHVLDGWPGRSRRLVEDLIARYGLPGEVSQNQVIWRMNGPWQRTVVHRVGASHNFPTPHMDILEQTVSYRMPVAFMEDVMRFDGSVLVNRTRGELTAWCHSEELNFILLNLVHDVVQGKKTVQEARLMVGKMVFRMRLGWPVPYAEGLQFVVAKRRDVEGNDAQDPDERV